MFIFADNYYFAEAKKYNTLILWQWTSFFSYNIVDPFDLNPTYLAF